jgi:hypothetical protein
MMPLLMLSMVQPALQADVVDEKLLDLLGYLESGNNDAASGDSGRSRGRFQQQEIFVRDVNRISKNRQAFTPSDRFDRDKAARMVIIWLNYWTPRMARKYHCQMGYREMLSLYRFGPTRWRPECCDHPVDVARWNKAKSYLDKE